MFDINQINSFESQNVVERVEQAKQISEELASTPHKEFLKKQNKKKKITKKQPKYSEKKIKQIIENSNRQLEGKDVKMEFEVFKLTNRVVIRLVDTTSNEIIKEISSEEALDSLVKNWGDVGNLIDMEG